MRKILSLTVACLLTSWMSAQTVANMDSMKAEKKSVATSIKLTGKLTTVGNSDFRQMRDLCWQLRHVDLSASDCPSIPKNAFHSRHHLQSIICLQSSDDWLTSLLRLRQTTIYQFAKPGKTSGQSCFFGLQELARHHHQWHTQDRRLRFCQPSFVEGHHFDFQDSTSS